MRAATGTSAGSSAVDVKVLRLVRVAVGGLTLGGLPKGEWRLLAGPEVASL